jgi:hypothetical protein
MANIVFGGNACQPDTAIDIEHYVESVVFWANGSIKG